MDTAITFSVLTPCLNPGRYLEQALDSVYSQQGDFFIQSIIVDGGSTDNTADILRRLEGTLRDSVPGCHGIEMLWTSEPDRGQSDALNKALARARGDVLVILNADDWFAPGAFQAVAEAFTRDPSLNLVFGDCMLTDTRKHLLSTSPSRSFVNDPETFSPFTGGEEWVLVTPEVFYRAHLVQGFQFDPTLNYFLDIDLWLHLFRNVPKMEKIEKTLACFRAHDDCKTVKAWKNFLPQLLVEYLWLVSRHGGRMDPLDTKRRFGRLISHFLANWQRLGVVEENHDRLRRLLKERAFSNNEINAFYHLYAAAHAEMANRVT